MHESEHPAATDAMPVTPVEPKPRTMPKVSLPLGPDLLPELRRYLMMRQVLLGALVLLLLLHLAAPGLFDLGTLLLLAGLYALIVGSGGLEAARLGSAGDRRRQERLAEDALRRAGRLQSHLEPGSATDDVASRILAQGREPRQAVILAGNEAEDALRAVYRHYAQAERMAGTTDGTGVPLTFLVQELIWRGLLAPDIYDTAEPILALREIALAPRTQIAPQVANDCVRAAQAVALRVQSLGIEIHPRRTPLSWLRGEEPGASADTTTLVLEKQRLAMLEEKHVVVEPTVDEDGQTTTFRPRPVRHREPDEGAEGGDVGPVETATAPAAQEPARFDTRRGHPAGDHQDAPPT